MANIWLPYALRYLRVFRVVVVSAFVLLAVLGWFTHIQWLFACGICIATGELLESTYYIVLIRWGQRSGRLAIRPASRS